MEFIEEDNTNGEIEVNSSVTNLLNLWRTETNSPEILQYDHELVNSIKDLLRDQQVRYWFVFVLLFEF